MILSFLLSRFLILVLSIILSFSIYHSSFLFCLSLSLSSPFHSLIFCCIILSFAFCHSLFLVLSVVLIFILPFISFSFSRSLVLVLALLFWLSFFCSHSVILSFFISHSVFLHYRFLIHITLSFSRSIWRSFALSSYPSFSCSFVLILSIILTITLAFSRSCFIILSPSHSLVLIYNSLLHCTILSIALSLSLSLSVSFCHSLILVLSFVHHSIYCSLVLCSLILVLTPPAILIQSFPLTSVLKAAVSISSGRYEAPTDSMGKHNKWPCFFRKSAEDKTKYTNIRHLQSEKLQTSYQNKSQISAYNTTGFYLLENQRIN